MKIDKITLLKIIHTKNEEIINNYYAEGIHFDSRNIKKRNIFIALKGYNTDGHKYILDAFYRGASLFIVSKDFNLNNFPESDRLIFTNDDTLHVFHTIAKWWRSKLNIPIISVTGSAGKTMVKDMIFHILSKFNTGSSSQKSYNNHIGVPYTICNIKQNDKWAIIEVGMNHIGEIHSLTNIILPSIGIITSIEPVHIGLLGNIDNIAQAKLELLHGMKKGSPVIVPDNNHILNKNINKFGINQDYKVYKFGSNKDTDCYITNIKQFSLTGTSFDLYLFGEKIVIFTKMIGDHIIKNIACAALACKIAFPTITNTIIKDQIESFLPPEMRLNIIKFGPDKIIINDAYNANPASVKMGLKILHGLKKYKKIGIVIGDMLELGHYSAYYHNEVAQQICQLKPTFFISVGHFSKIISDATNKYSIKSINTTNSNDPIIIDFINKHKWDLLFVKGSRQMHLENIINGLTA